MTLASKVSLKDELIELRHAMHRRFLSAETTSLITKVIKDRFKTAARKGLAGQTLSIRDVYTQIDFLGEALTQDELIYIRKYIISWLKEQNLECNDEETENIDFLDVVWCHES